MTRAQKKNAKKKQKKKEKKGTEVAFEIEEVIEGLEDVSLSTAKPQATPEQTPSTPASAPECSQERLSCSVAEQSSRKDVAERGLESSSTTEQQSKEVLKRVRAVRKKLKQIEELEARIASGDITKPDQDQLNKLAKKDEFLEELRELQEC